MYAAIAPVGTMTTKGQNKDMKKYSLKKVVIGFIIGGFMSMVLTNLLHDEHKETKQHEIEMQVAIPIETANKTDSIPFKNLDELSEAIDLMIKNVPDDE